jgi:hypothetical protein
MEVKTIHKVLAVVWAVLLALVAGIFVLALYFSVTSPANYQATSGLGFLFMAVLQGGVFYLAPFTFIIVAGLFLRDWWIESRKLSAGGKGPVTPGFEHELRSLRQSVEALQRKINHIESILEQVSE